MDNGIEDQLDLDTVIVRFGLNEGDQPNALMPNFDNAKKLVNVLVHTIVIVNFLRMRCMCMNIVYFLLRTADFMNNQSRYTV